MKKAKNQQKTKIKKNKRKNIAPISKIEFLFNIISYILIILLAIYIGYRSLFYYSKQNIKEQKESNTLAAIVIKNNEKTTEQNGFHQDKEGYYFTGLIENNYVKIFNRIYRIMEINNKNEVKIVSNDNEASLIYGDNSTYKESNIYKWLNKTDNINSGIYYKTIPGVEKLLTKTSYCEGYLKDSKVECKESNKKDYFTILTLNDYVKALGKNSYLNNGKNSFILGYDQDNSPLTISEDGTVNGSNTYEGNGIRVVMTLKKDIKITNGTGTKEDPYIIDQENNDNYINKYVKLDNAIYQIYEEQENNIKLRLNDYLKVKDAYYETYYSKNKENTFNPKSRYNIAYYLNNTYYKTLTYKDMLSECTFLTGESTSTDTVNYENMYNSTVTAKIGLPNIYDLNTNQELTDYYLINTTTNKSNLSLVYDKSGQLKEDKSSELRKIVPVICLDKNILNAGTGTKEDPYRLQ